MKQTVELKGEGKNTLQVFEDFLTSRDIQRLFGISPYTLDKWCQQNLIRYFRPSGGKRLFRKADVFEFIDKREKSAGLANPIPV